ncbi:MAG: AAA family ATPase [Gammaproteobacteria bacterium]|nr:AAA family ATPase [Gammaproteobacteria bacterium]
MTYYPRTFEINELKKFAEQDKAGFLYVRGRRRIGKSWVLINWSSKRKNCIYFSGKKDATKQETLRQFIQTWYQATQSKILLELRFDLISWDRIFSEILLYQTKLQQKVILIFDEIQWIAKEGSGFIGSLKAAWVSFEISGFVSIVVCGSSNKFFSDKVGGEEKILRGIATRSPLWIHPVPLRDVKKFFFPKWNEQEVALTYLLFGGVPYYLSQLEGRIGFVHAINRAAFSRESIFIHEVDEVLGLEFNKAGLETVKKILSGINIFGASQSDVRKTLEISSSTVSEVFEKLIDYGILFLEEDFGKRVSISRKGIETRYFLRDFYLNFYFSVYQKYVKRILTNSDGKNLIFSDSLLSKKGYYIENFSGKAFENLVRDLFLNNSPTSCLFKKLQLVDNDFELGTYRSRTSQIDLVVKHNRDRLVRIIECKWGQENSHEIDELCHKAFPLAPTEQRMNVMIRSPSSSKRYEKICRDNQVILLNLSDLFK